MNSHRDIDELLAADNLDAGCTAGFEVLHQYVDAELAGDEPARSQPGIAVHLRSCPACLEDYRGLLDAAARFGEADPTTP